MSPIVLRQEKVIVILMTGKIGYRSLEILDLIERGLGSGDALGEFFHPGRILWKVSRRPITLERSAPVWPATGLSPRCFAACLVFVGGE